MFLVLRTTTKSVKLHIGKEFGARLRVRFIGDLRWVARFGINPDQSTCRQGQPKVRVQQFHGLDEDQFGIFWAVLVQFGLGIMCSEGFWEFKFLGSSCQKVQIWKC